MFVLPLATFTFSVVGNAYGESLPNLAPRSVSYKLGPGLAILPNKASEYTDAPLGGVGEGFWSPDELTLGEKSVPRVEGLFCCL